MISRSRDMVGAHQNLNGSRDLTTPLLGMVCYLTVSTKFEVSNSTHYEDMKGDTTCRKWGSLGFVSYSKSPKQQQSIEDIRASISVP